MKWKKTSKLRYTAPNGDEILKYSMAGVWYYLYYVGGVREYADYKTFKTLKSAKFHSLTTSTNK